MAKFEGNWATREFVKGICQNARRHAKKMGDTSGKVPEALLNPEADEDLDEEDEEHDEPAGRFSTFLAIQMLRALPDHTPFVK